MNIINKIISKIEKIDYNINNKIKDNKIIYFLSTSTFVT